MTLKLERATTWTQKRLKLGMVSSFDAHNMCAKVERITPKTGCTSCTNWTISFKVQGFQTKTHQLQRHFIFLTLFQLKTLVCIQHATLQATYRNFNPFWLHLLFFMHLMIYFQLNDLEIRKGTTWTQKRLKLGMVSSFDAHNMSSKVERITAKTGCTSCTNWTISFEVWGFKRKLICYKSISFY